MNASSCSMTMLCACLGSTGAAAAGMENLPVVLRRQPVRPAAEGWTDQRLRVSRHSRQIRARCALFMPKDLLCAACQPALPAAAGLARQRSLLQQAWRASACAQVTRGRWQLQARPGQYLLPRYNCCQHVEGS